MGIFISTLTHIMKITVNAMYLRSLLISLSDVYRMTRVLMRLFADLLFLLKFNFKYLCQDFRHNIISFFWK
ncbi:hypothetical protein MASR1M36_17150 [Candidatus Cloacimonadaceae bacterium]